MASPEAGEPVILTARTMSTRKNIPKVITLDCQRKKWYLKRNYAMKVCPASKWMHMPYTTKEIVFGTEIEFIVTYQERYQFKQEWVDKSIAHLVRRFQKPPGKQKSAAHAYFASSSNNRMVDLALPGPDYIWWKNYREVNSVPRTPPFTKKPLLA